MLKFLVAPRLSTASICAVAATAMTALPSSISNVSTAYAPGPDVTAAQQSRIVHVSATDKAGGVVTDLQAADFEVKLAGKSQDVVSAQPSAIPLRVSVLVADGGTGVFQVGLGHFVNTLLGHGEVALTSIVRQPEKFIDFSSDGGALSMAVWRLGRRGQPQAGAQLMEAIQDATREVAHETSRPRLR